MTEEANCRGPFRFQVDVPFSPRWQHADLLRTSILNCLATVFRNYDFCGQLGMATGELAENAIHYGRWHDGAARFRLVVRGDERHVSVEVTNPCDTSGSHIERLLHTVERINRSESVHELYTERLREIAAAPEVGGSGLGLLRIAFETDCELTARIDDGAVSVCASLPTATQWPEVEGPEGTA